MGVKAPDRRLFVSKQNTQLHLELYILQIHVVLCLPEREFPEREFPSQWLIDDSSRWRHPIRRVGLLLSRQHIPTAYLHFPLSREPLICE